MESIPDTLIDYFKDHFRTTDDYTRDFKSVDAKIMNTKASLLIYKSITTGNQLLPFMKTEISEINNNQEYALTLEDLKELLKTTPSYLKGYYQCINEYYNNATFKNIGFKTDKTKDYQYFIEPIFNVIANSDLINFNNPNQIDYSYTGIINNPLSNDRASEYAIEFLKEKVKHFTIFDYFKMACSNQGYKTPESICNAFDTAPYPYAPCNIVLDNKSRKDFEVTLLNENTIKVIKQYNNCLENYILEDISLGNNHKEFVYNKHFKTVFYFKNEHEKAVQKVIKIYYEDTKTKELYPTTILQDNLELCIPLQKGQILYNLDILDNIKINTVILTDSIEIAHRNQEIMNDENIVWSSWLTDKTHSFINIDWKPLKGKTVYYLITNHSGQSLAEAYEGAKKLQEYFKDNLHKVSLNFIQVKINNNAPMHENIIDIMQEQAYNNSPIEESVQIFTEDNISEFETMYEKAMDVLNHKRKEWWEKQENNTNEVKDNKNSHKSKKLFPAFILRPFIEENCISIMYGSSGVGKSSMALSMCNSILLNKNLIKNFSWNIPKKAPDRKIMYLNFEMNEDQIIRYTTRLSPELLKQENFIMENRRNSVINFMKEEARSQVLSLINKAKNKGLKDKQIDLLVIDSYTKIIGGGEHIKSWPNILPLLKEINKMGIAILIIDHARNDGAERGFNHKVDDFDFLLSLKSLKDNKEKQHDFNNDKTQCFMQKDRNYTVSEEVDFKIKIENNKWIGFDTNEAEAVVATMNIYKEGGSTQKDIYSILGMGRQKYNNFLQKVKK